MKKRKNWPPQRIAQLELLCSDMTSDELAIWFQCSPQNIRDVCYEYGFQWQHHKGRRGYLNAQESIALFKQQYRHHPINQLLTKNWRHYEQV